MSTPKRPCLLVVDDEPEIGASVYALLRREYDVLRAQSAAEGQRLMQEHEVHIVMTDQRMPEVTGVELLASVRVRHPRAVRLLFTGYADHESLIAAINDGRVFRFLKKPWRPEELEAAVRAAAAEYHRIATEAEELERLRARVAALEQKVTELERVLLRG
jgi:response regulator RpfG family c-di-GMP phosphodiesterase